MQKARPAPLIDIAGLAERLGVSQRFVRRLIAERRVPFFKVGKFIRFDSTDIDRWIENNRVV
jgi:excisionase family DNA binding protein